MAASLGEQQMALLRFFTQLVNASCSTDDWFAASLPLTVGGFELLLASRDGRLLCKLLNMASPGAVDERVILSSPSVSEGDAVDNVQLLLNSVRGLGCPLDGLTLDGLLFGQPSDCLRLCEAILLIFLRSAVSFAARPEILRLLEPGEDSTVLYRMQPEEVLLRWVNHHLRNAGSELRLKDMAVDLRDGDIYVHLLHAVWPDACSLDALAAESAAARVAAVLEAATTVGADVSFMTVDDILAGAAPANLFFLARLLSHGSGLHVTEEELYAAAGAAEEDSASGREQSTLRTWISSLPLPDGCVVHHLIEDLKTGVIILHIMDFVLPGIVEWRRVHKRPRHKFASVENCNYAVKLGKDAFRFRLVNIGGTDILDGNVKLILSIVWQLMRYHQLAVLSSDSGSKRSLSDRDVVKWANGMVAASGRTSKIRNLTDASLKSGRFLLELLDAVRPGIVPWKLVLEGALSEQAESNARLLISLARRLGACVFIAWQDVVEVNSRMLLPFLATVMQIERGVREAVAVRDADSDGVVERSLAERRLAVKPSKVSLT
eukprot:PLAT635.1.p1 GENE.PLAT635.1~~PLAT635.1.p1  ORF type:complete len:641 (+),score=319.80 PLAT635.1:280-1923(+)